MMEINRQNDGRGEASNKSKTIYARGADDGLWMGVYMFLAFLLMALSMNYALLNIPALAMIVGVPVLAYFYLRRTHLAAHGMTLFSALWMQGITMFVCGSLVFGVLAFVFLKWLEPDFVVNVLNAGIEYYERAGTEATLAMADELRMIADSEALPSLSTVVMVWMWLIMFSGSVLSAMVSAVVKAVRVHRS